MKNIIALFCLFSFSAFAGVQLDLQIEGADARGMRIEAFSSFTATDFTCLQLYYGSILAVPGLRQDFKKGKVTIKSDKLVSIMIPTVHNPDSCDYALSQSTVSVYLNDSEFFTFFLGKTSSDSSNLDILNPNNKLSLKCKGKTCTTLNKGEVVIRDKSYPKLRMNVAKPDGKATLKVRIH